MPLRLMFALAVSSYLQTPMFFAAVNSSYEIFPHSEALMPPQIGINLRIECVWRGLRPI